MEQIMSFDVNYEYGIKTNKEFLIDVAYEQPISQNHYVHLVFGKINSITKVSSVCFLTEYFKEIPLVIIFCTDKTIYFPLSYHFIQNILINTTFQNHFIKANSMRFKTHEIFSEEKGLIFETNNIFSLVNQNQFNIDMIYARINKKMYDLVAIYNSLHYNEFPINYILSNEKKDEFSLDSVIGLIKSFNSEFKNHYINSKIKSYDINVNYGQYRKITLKSDSVFCE